MLRGRVLLVDSSGEWLAAIHALLAEDEDLEVVGWARDGEEAVRRTADLLPDLVLMEVDLPDKGGRPAVQRLKRLPHAPLVLLMTAHRRHVAGLAAILAGSDGCLWKAHLGHRLLPSLRELLKPRG